MLVKRTVFLNALNGLERHSVVKRSKKRQAKKKIRKRRKEEELDRSLTVPTHRVGEAGLEKIVVLDR